MGGRGKAAKPAAAGKAGWERDQFTVRMTDLRRDCLRLISDGMPAGTTPNDAFDRALEMALAKVDSEPGSSPEMLARLDDLEELVAEMGRERAAEAAAQRAVEAETLAQVRSVAALISAVAAMPASRHGGDDDGQGDDISHEARVEPVVALRAWLDANGKGLQSFDCVGRWRTMSRLTDRFVAVDFEVAAPSRTGERSVVRVEPVDAASPLARVDQVAAVSLSCRRLPGAGWTVGARRLNQDRSIGPAICEFRV